MRISLKSFLLFASLLSLTACNSPGDKDETITNGDTALSKHGTSDVIKAKFDEGEINVLITTPGSAIGELVQKVDLKKGNVSAQMKALAEKLSAKERAELELRSKKAGILNLAILMLPIQSVIYVKGKEATAKFDALTYHGENTMDEHKKEGMMYIKSQNSEKALTFRYNDDSFKNMASTELKPSDYDIVNTSETALVAGYLCKKSVYTLKKGESTEKSIAGMPGSGSIYQIDVWTSTQMPKAVNFLHPIYIKEDAGIMKLLIKYNKENDLNINYEFKTVQSRKVTDEEMSIQKTKKISDLSKDMMSVGTQMMELSSECRG